MGNIKHIHQLRYGALYMRILNYGVTMIGEMLFQTIYQLPHNNSMLKHDSAHLGGACYINPSEILTQHKQALNKYETGDPALSLLPYTVQNESYHLSIDENRLGNAAYGQSSRISKLYHYVNHLLNIIFSVPQRKKPGFGYALTITGENLF